MNDKPTLTLSEFLLQRWVTDESEARYLRNVGLNGPQYGSVNGAFNGLVEHVPADIEAKRYILGLHQEHDDFGVCSSCLDTAYPCKTIRGLALPYTAHDDYRPEWRL